MEDALRRAPFGVVIAAADGVIVWTNESAAQLVGLTAAELLGHRPSEYVHPDDREALANARARGNVDGHVARFLDRHGVATETRISRTILEDDAKVDVGSISIVEDLTELRERDRQVALAAGQLDAVVDSAPVVLLGSDRHGIITFARGQPLAGLGLLSEDIVGHSAFDLFDDLRPDITACVRRALDGEEVRITTDWADEVIDAWFRPVWGVDGSVVGGICVGTVVTDRAAAEREQAALLEEQRRRERQQAAVATLGQLALVGDDFRGLCDHCCSLLVSTLADAEVAVFLDDGHPDGLLVVAGNGWALDQVDRRRARRTPDSPIGFLLASTEPVRSDDVYHDTRFLPPSDPANTIAGSVMGVHIETRGGAVGALLVSRPQVAPFSDRDVSFLTSMANVLGAAYDSDRVAEELRHNALHDSLTGLPNRTLLTDRLEHAISQAALNQRRVGVIVCDLDRFKLVNDSHGHLLGDELLIAVADRLAGVIRPGDTVARFGGDEFVVVCADVDDEGDVVRVAERLGEAFADPVTMGADTIFTSASMGIAVGDQGALAADLLRDADTAMYRAKDEGRGRWEVFDDVLRARARHRLDTESALRRAIKGDELVLHYQPIVSVGNGQLLGVEALVRWQHPDRGLLGPFEFVPIAEESGLIRDLGDWVLRAAAAQTGEWVSAGLWNNRTTSINVASAQMDGQLPQRVAEAAEHARVDPVHLRVEITETVLLRDTKAAEEVLRQLRAMGVRASIDDFGTGYSSLAYLAELSVDILKIDRAFIQGLVTNDAGRVITEAVTRLAHSLDLRAVAEGVETAQQVNALRALGCDAMQGFLISRPVEAGIVTDMAAR